jgi:hypothetical protein
MSGLTETTPFHQYLRVVDNIGVPESVQRFARAYRFISDNIGQPDSFAARSSTFREMITDNAGITDTVTVKKG